MGMSGMGRRADRASSGNLQTLTSQLRQTAQLGFVDGGANHQPSEQPFAEKERPSFAKLGDKLGDQLKMLQRG